MEPRWQSALKGRVFRTCKFFLPGFNTYRVKEGLNIKALERIVLHEKGSIIG
jgi:hypothetical protein